MATSSGGALSAAHYYIFGSLVAEAAIPLLFTLPGTTAYCHVTTRNATVVAAVALANTQHNSKRARIASVPRARRACEDMALVHACVDRADIWAPCRPPN